MHGQVCMQRRILFQASASGCGNRAGRSRHTDAERL
nr:MAG TPA: hypothetical protein [Bacteriophage sp.]